MMTWEILLQTESSKPYFKEMMAYLDHEQLTKTVYPKKDEWFQCFLLTKLSDVKVVIIGQDPYHGINQAHGLAFSVKNAKLPPSLKNIYKEIESDLNIKMSGVGDLTSWAKQGVLLLNTLLTVEAHKPLSHNKIGWQTFSLEVIKLLNQTNQPIVYLLWGSEARKLKTFLTNKNHLVLESVHPSPLSAYQGFFGCKHFSQANAFLSKYQVKTIDWQL